MRIRDQHSFPINLKAKYLVIGLILFAFIILIINNLNTTNNDEDLNFNKRFGVGERNVDLINLNELFHIGDCLLKQSASRIVKIRIDSLNNKQMEFEHKKDDDSVVTTADLESHNIIVHSLKDKYKNLVVKSEENTNDNFFDSGFYLQKCDTYRKKSDDRYAPVTDLIVYIDPLDATQEYSENLVDYVTVMFCLVDKGIPKAGIIHKPFNNETVSSFYQKLHLKRSSKLGNKNRVIVSRSHAGTVKSIIGEKMNDAQVLTAAGSGYKTVQLIRNEADVYLHTTLIKRWDICAPNAILNNLGGKLTKLNGEIVDYSDHVKSNVVNGILASLYDYDYFIKIFKRNE